MIQLDKVSYRFTAQSDFALRDIILSIKSGERVCLLGANGSGKTTLALLIAGVLQATSGLVQKNYAKDATLTSESQVGLLFQNPDNQMVAMVVENDIAFSLENKGMNRDVMFSRVAEQIASFNLSALSGRVVSTLSGGEKQMVALCGVMVDSPPVLILDEPDSFLDRKSQKLLAIQLDNIRDKIPSLIEIRLSPRPLVAMKYARLCVLRDGFLVYDGSPKSVINSDEKLSEYGLLATGADSGPERSAFSFHPGNESEIVMFKDVSFSYEKGCPVLRNCSLSLHSGEILGLTGATGSGKSTVGQLFCGLLEPDKGELWLRDKDGHESRPGDLPGHMVGTFQQPERQFFLATCTEEIRYGPKNIGRILSDEQVGAFLMQANLEPGLFARRDPGTLSLGEKRRLAIACLLSMLPTFLVFDEPTAGLDPVGESWFKEMAGRLRNQGCGILLISHDTDLVLSLSDRICSLNNRSVREISADSLSSE